MTGSAAPSAALEPWQPVLEGELAREALEAARQIGRNLADALRGAEPGAVDSSLGEGTAGLALALSYLASRDGGASGDAAALATRALTQAPLASAGDLSLFGGRAGPAWALAHVGCRNGIPMDAVVAEVDDDVLELVSTTHWTGAFDLIGGLVGLGVYALERLPHPSARAAVGQVVERLAETAGRRDGGLTWWTSPALFPEERRAEFPRGHWNLGVAHGAPGVVAFLGRVVAAGVAAERAAELLDGAVPWLLRQRADSVRGRFAKWTGPGLTPVFRQAWCYGDPGVAAALLLAARSVGNAAWERDATALAVDAARRSPEVSGVVSADLCHGAAGLGHLFGRLWQATGDERLVRAATYWFEDAVRRVKADAGAEERGFLQGSAGVALALLSAATPTEPEWDRVLLLSGSPGEARA